MTRLRYWLLRGAITTGSVALSLVLLELFLRLFAPQPLNLYNFALLNEEGAVVKSVGLMTGGSFYRADIKPPGRGPMRPNQRLRMGNVDIEINEHGWRDRTYPRKAAPGTHRLMVVGDSVTLGYGVPLADTYHKRLEDRLNQAGSAVGRRFDVVALGGGGGTTYDELGLVRHHIGYFEPRELWLAFNLNDILFNPHGPLSQRGEEGKPGQAARREPGPSLFVQATMVLRWLNLGTDLLLRPRSHLYHLLRQRAKVQLRYFGIYSPTMQPEAAFAFSSEQAQQAWSATLAAILDIREEAVRYGARFSVVVLPADPQTSPDTAALYRDQFHFRFDDGFAEGVVQQRICQDLRRRDIDCLDPLPLFRAHSGQPLFLRVHGDSVDWNHPNSAGHALLAEALFAALKPRLLPDDLRSGLVWTTPFDIQAVGWPG